MSANKDLARFVRDALTAGHAREEIAKAIQEAGWSTVEAEEALAAWSTSDFSPPVPRPQSVVTARDFFFYGLMFGLLLFGSIHLVILGQSLIDIVVDGKGQSRIFPVRQTQWAISVLIVTGPLFIWLGLRDLKRLAGDPSLYRSAVRKWAMYVTLLATAAVMIGNGVWVVYDLLRGEMTSRSLADAVILGAVALGVFSFAYIESRKSDKG